MNFFTAPYFGGYAKLDEALLSSKSGLKPFDAVGAAFASLKEYEADFRPFR